MAKNNENPSVDFYFNKDNKWQKEIGLLRTIALDCGLTEELKWGCPCYTFPDPSEKQKSNIVLIHVFKDYCAFLFFKGALLKDTHGILIQQTANVQAARQIRFTSSKEIVQLKNVVKAYIFEAVEVERAGLKVSLKKTTAYDVPEEFKKKLSGKSGAALKTAFDALTPGRQRAYLLYFAAAKQSSTRASRIEKCIPQIMAGKGLND
jgi:uncharacterized protein YdeI (YjbR/CyaY-like superfamily)